MITLTFISDRLDAPVVATASAGMRLIDVVRPLALSGRLPLAWRCGQGTCGACRVRIAHAAQPAPLAMGKMERNVLARIVPDAATGEIDTPDTVRLACHLTLAHDLTVYFS